MKRREWFAGPDIYYNHARFYAPALGRFLAEDPLGYGGGDSNLYSFAWNNPKNWSDPSGLRAAAEEGTIDQATAGAILGDGVVTTAEGTTALATGADAASVAAAARCRRSARASLAASSCWLMRSPSPTIRR